MSGLRLKQTLTIGAVAILLAFLFTRDVKGLVTPEEDKNKPAAAVPAADESMLTLEQTSTIAKNLVSREVTAEIVALENNFNSAKEAEKVKAAGALSRRWERAEQYIPSALYADFVANNSNTLENWLQSGKKYLNAFNSTQDSTVQPALLQRANAAYKKALAIDTANAVAKTGIGITIVNGLGMPMDGIAMLLEVIKKDPRNTQALMQLGMFSMKSGQFDKAVGRFKEVIAIQPSSEVYFYLGTALESLDKNGEAIEAYLQSKKIAANPTLSAWVDKKVAELKK